MPKISYIEKQFKADSLALIERCNAVIVDYQRQGFSLTLRQLYYQMVSRNIIENTERSYKRLGDLVSNARLAGLIDWGAIEDRGRNLRQHSHWATPADIIRSARHSYKVDKWEGQRYRPEVWVEKQALEGVGGRGVWSAGCAVFCVQGVQLAVGAVGSGAAVAGLYAGWV